MSHGGQLGPMDEIELIRASQDGGSGQLQRAVKALSEAGLQRGFRMLGERSGSRGCHARGLLLCLEEYPQVQRCASEPGCSRSRPMPAGTNSATKRRPLFPLESLPYDPPSVSTESPEDYAVRKEMAEHVQ